MVKTEQSSTSKKPSTSCGNNNTSNNKKEVKTKKTSQIGGNGYFNRERDVIQNNYYKEDYTNFNF